MRGRPTASEVDVRELWDFSELECGANPSRLGGNSQTRMILSLKANLWTLLDLCSCQRSFLELPRLRNSSNLPVQQRLRRGTSLADSGKRFRSLDRHVNIRYF